MRLRLGVAGFVVVTWTTQASADDKAECVDAYVAAQTLRAEHKLLSARENLVVCSRGQCDDAMHGQIVHDCTEWLGLLQPSIPTVVFAIRSQSGKEGAPDVAIFIDGGEQPHRVDGLAFEMDPGPHRFVFSSGSVRREQVVVVLEGVKNQLVEAELPVSTERAGPASPEDTQSPAVPPRRASPFVSLPTVVALGVAAAGVGVGTVFGIVALSDRAKLDRSCSNSVCAPPAQPSDVDALHTAAWTSNVGFAVGAAALVTAIVLWATDGTARTHPVATARSRSLASVDLRPSFGPRVLGVSGAFP